MSKVDIGLSLNAGRFGNENAEIRVPKEIRSSKSEGLAHAAGALRIFGRLGFGSSVGFIGRVGVLLSMALLALGGVVQAAAPTTDAPRAPRLAPDYAGLEMPANISPLNFVIAEPEVTRHEVKLVGAGGGGVETSGSSAEVRFPIKGWKSLLGQNVGRPIYMDIRVQNRAGAWTQFQRVTNWVSADPMDGHLAYRLLRPVYNVYGPIGVYQRDLSTARERPILENRNLESGCLNCHTFLNRRPETMALHIRHKGVGNPMLLVQSNAVARIDKTSGYLSWHPSGRLLTFSMNKFALLFHTAGETRDLYDAASDLGIYRVDSNTVVNVPAIARPDRFETWPSWSPDGRYLYFCAAPGLKIERLKQIRYDLMRVAYDIGQDKWGEPETMVSAQETRLSAAQPRVSPDNNWLLYCLAPNGNFPAYQPGSDIYMMDLRSRQARRLEINSDVSDSWHCWSSNGRWMVFSSKRRDGLFTRPYFTHMTPEGQFSKPFILPQEDPRFYESFGRTYNLPEFIQSPVTVSSSELVRAVFHPDRVLKPVEVNPSGTPAEHEADEGRSADLSPPRP